MYTLRWVTLALTLVGTTTLPGCVAAAPPPYYGETAGTFPEQWGDDLAPYGAWRTIPNYGTVWSPNVAPGWRPYTYGYWGAGSSQWVWFSSEPWGFTFHYGRWAYAPIGWIWVPGTVWGPAWVDWYWGNGYVGWAPLGYYGVVPWAQYVFVRDYEFGCSQVNRVAYYNHHYYNHPKHYHRGPPPRAHVQQVAHYPIVRVSDQQLPHRVLPPPGHGGVVRQQPRAQSPTRARVPLERPEGSDRVTPSPSVPRATPPGQAGAPRLDPIPVRPHPGGGPQHRYDERPPSAAPPRVSSPPRVSVSGSPTADRRPSPPAPTVSAPRYDAPRVVPMPTPRPTPQSSPAAPTAPAPRPSGQYERMQLAPSVTGGARGYGSSGAFPPQGMR
jgi:hypothetical protein